jgi:hypothetical protein
MRRKCTEKTGERAMKRESTNRRVTAIVGAACLASVFALAAHAQTTGVEAGINSSTNAGINATPNINTATGAASPLPGAATTSGNVSTAPTATTPGANSAPAESEDCTSSKAAAPACASGTGTPTNAISTPPETDYPLYPWEDGVPPGS